jgi:hypothetical protein
MAAVLSTLSSIKSLCLKFPSPQSRPNQNRRHSHLPPCSHLFEFQGVGEYLEDLLARIDVPQLDDLRITLFYLKEADSAIDSENMLSNGPCTQPLR